MIKQIRSFILAFLPLTSLHCQISETEFLNRAYSKLDSIKQVTYTEYIGEYYSGDTTGRKFDPHYITEYDNRNDTTIGASFLKFKDKDKTIFSFGYDGTRSAYINEEDSVVQMRDYEFNPKPDGDIPFRVIGPPFFNYVKNILLYSLNTKDSINIFLKEEDEFFYYKLTIHNSGATEFFGKAYIQQPHIMYDPTSQYEIWFDKKDFIPVKYRRTQDHDQNFNLYKDIKWSFEETSNINIHDYLPKGYKIVRKGENKNSGSKDKFEIEGNKMPDWVLNDTFEKEYKSNDIKSKVILIQFTSTGCGACVASIPYLKELRQKYSTEDLEILAVECWGTNPIQVRKHIEKFNMNYPYLIGKNDMLDSFRGKHTMAPLFFIIDQQRNVKKVITGFNSETTVTKINELIEESL